MADRSKILLADSDPRRAMPLIAELQKRGWDVVSTNDAVHTLNVARQAQPDLVIVNSQLAGGGGLAALKRLRSNVYTANIPILALVTGPAAQERELLGAGAAQCFPATVDAAKLHGAISENMLQTLDFTQAPAAVLADPPRIAALHDTALLDSPPEQSFDRLTLLASRLLGTPTALVTLIDKDRQFFKSQVGLRQPWAGERQTRLSHSFCQWVVASKEPLVVQDANGVPALRGNLAIRDLGVIAYAGMPISGKDGEAIGSLCAIDSRPREWTEEDLATLADLRRIAEAYARLKSARGGAGGDAVRTSLAVAANAILGAGHILRRHGERIGAAERTALLDIIDEQAAHLLGLAPGR